MQRNANMLKILKKVRFFSDFIGFFVEMQSLVCPPERTFALLQSVVIYDVSSVYKVLDGRK